MANHRTVGTGIIVKILGDYGPFSRMGKSIGYELSIGKARYLIDCGTPLFQQIGGEGLKEIKGLVITHCHDDHKRWFSDLALFTMYQRDAASRVSLIASEGVYNELMRGSGPALDRSLSLDSKRIIDISHEEYVDYQRVGPRAKYRIESKLEGHGKTGLYVTEGDGNVVGPEVAKIVINPKTRNPRMLFKDSEYNEWIEPESFYAFSSEVFYEKDQNIFIDEEGFSIQAIKAPVWHGIPAVGIKVKTAEETLIFSSDTVHDEELWKDLSTEKREQKLDMSREEFERAGVIYGDINNYVERIWSEERYREAINAFEGAVVIHDISAKNSIVHTDYEQLKNTSLKKDKVLLTHSPDRMTSEWALCDSGKTFKIEGDTYYEVVDGKLYPMDADVYHKEGGRYYAGYKNEQGEFTVFEKDGLLGLTLTQDIHSGMPLYRVDLYEDVNGKYFPKIKNRNAQYQKRMDGKVELVGYTDEGSVGRVMENIRDKLEIKNTFTRAER